jgi:hypothetical protein
MGTVIKELSNSVQIGELLKQEFFFGVFMEYEPCLRDDMVG